METADASDIGPVGDEPRGPDQPYALALSDTEVTRYQRMAECARITEADLWQRAGIVAGAQVADVGCRPGALLPALAGAVGPTGRVVVIDADPRAVATARAVVAASGLANVTVRQGRADRTGLPPESCDVVMVLQKGSAFPAALSVVQSLHILVMVLLGGMQSFAGPLLGAGLYKLLDTVVTTHVEYWSAVLGVILGALVLLAPEGVLGYMAQRWERWRRAHER